MKGISGLIRRKAALLAMIALILLAAGSASACGSKAESPEKGGKEQNVYNCQLSIRCDTALSDDRLDEKKRNILPESGVIFAETKVDFQEGDTVYDVLQRVTKEQKIQMESAESPLYESQYIEGIANLYELDCGELSGWMYSVNDTFPRMGCSKYKVEKGDRIQWIYSCNLGKDIGGSNFQ